MPDPVPEKESAYLNMNTASGDIDLAQWCFENELYADSAEWLERAIEQLQSARVKLLRNGE